VLGNDTLNGVPVTTANTDVTPVTNGPLSVDTNGNLTVAVNTPSGTYTVIYQLCETGANPTNCTTATATVVVSNPIDAIDDTNSVAVNGYTGGIAIPTVLSNDILNNLLVQQSQTTITLTSILPAGITFNLITGQVAVNPQTAAGNYTFTYNLCEVGAIPANCNQATVTIKVGLAIIDALNDDYTTMPISSYPGGTTPSVIVNDKLNTLPVIIGTLPGQVKLTPVSVPGGLTLNANGTVSVASNTAAGAYVVTYSICEVINPTNCDTATAIVVVTAQRPSITLIKTATAVDENGDGFATVGETIRYNFTITNTGNVPLTNITITDLLPGLALTGGSISLAPGQVDTTSFVGIYTITQTDANNEQVENQATVYGTSPLGIIVKDLSDNYSTTSDGATVLSVKNCVVIVSNALTPNGDGLNEYFHIEGLDCFSNNTVEIYNRWGVLVFETSKYNNVDNVFEGYSRGRTTINQSVGLPIGTYYYVLKYVDFSGNGVQKAGYLFLNR
jgi:uncharacterized repeat protein (TIGR01451 family)/gliding motility-associated-like protein